jgi:acyl-CoA thioester hydrolase
VTSPGAEPFELPLRVEPGDIDELNHVNNVVYLRWVQDVAIAHWKVLATPAEQAEVAWVAVRHEIDYRYPAVPGDGIIARTWVGAASGLRFERHTEILRARDRKLLARARTVWCPVDARTGRPKEVSPQLRARFSAAPE